MYCRCERRLGLDEDAQELRLAEGLELDPDREASLELGIRSDGLAMWKAPAAMKRMWSCAPARAWSPPSSLDDRQEVALHPFARDVGAVAALAPAILSISSRKMIPACSTRVRRRGRPAGGR